MVTSLGVAALLGILGTLAAVLWTRVLALGGAPGSLLTGLGTRFGKRPLVAIGAFLSFAVEVYLVLTFAALVIRAIQAVLIPRPDLPPWPLWIAGFYLATAPVLFGGRDAPGAAARDATDVAFAFALPLAGIGFCALALWPDLLEAGWGWVPSFRL